MALTASQRRTCVKTLQSLSDEIPVPNFMQPLLETTPQPDWLYVHEFDAVYPSVEACVHTLKIARRDVKDSLRSHKGVFYKPLECCLHIVPLKEKNIPVDRTHDLIPNVWAPDIDRYIVIDTISNDHAIAFMYQQPVPNKTCFHVRTKAILEPGSVIDINTGTVYPSLERAYAIHGWSRSKLIAPDYSTRIIKMPSRIADTTLKLIHIKKGAIFDAFASPRA